MNRPPRAPRDRRYSTQAWRRVREQVRERDGHTCQVCGRVEPTDRQKTFPVDHRNPGGDFYDPAGLWLLCWSCNTSKSGMSVEEWYAKAGKQRPADKPRSLFARPTFTSAEAQASQELGRIRAAVEAWRKADMDSWPIVDGPPAHAHPRWSARCVAGRWDVCPPGCATPVRWRAA